MEERLKDDFCIEAIKYRSEALNFSFANASDFWKVKEAQELQIQSLTVPLAFRHFDRSRTLINVIYPQSILNKGLLHPKALFEEKSEAEPKRKSDNGFSFSRSMVNKPKLEIELNENSVKNEEVNDLKEKIKHFGEIIAEKQKFSPIKESLGESPIGKALYIETVNIFTLLFS